MPRCPTCLLAILFAVALLSAEPLKAASAIWQSAPPPRFPEAALKRGSEGYVMLRANIAPDGAVTRVTITKPSGDSTLDEVARAAVLKWKMKPAAIKPQYATAGYNLRIDFQQSGPAVEQYRDRTAFFSKFESTKIWMSAPAPEYPYELRRGRIEGITFLKVVIGPDGTPAKVEMLKSSGNATLDSNAIAAVRMWRAHKQYAGMVRLVPVRFTLHPFR